MLTKSSVIFSVLSFLPLGSLPAAFAEDFVVDSDHTSVTFEVSHLAISSVKGSFSKVGGSFQFDPANIEKTTVDTWVEAKSVNTGVEKRDKHLRSPDFFDVKKFPKIMFLSKSVKSTGKDTFQISGDFTMHGVTKPVTFEAKFKGQSGAGGKQRTAFRGTTKIIRQDFGMNFGAVLEAVPMVGDEVEISIDVEGIRKKDL